MNKTTKCLAAVMIGLLGGDLLNAQSLQFSFDYSGTTTSDLVAGVSLNLVNANGNAADYHASPVPAWMAMAIH